MVCPGGADLEVCDLGSALGLPKWCRSCPIMILSFCDVDLEVCDLGVALGLAKWCRSCPIMVSPSGVDLEVYGLGLALRPANMVLLPAQLHCDEFLGLETIDAALSVSMNDYRRPFVCARRHRTSSVQVVLALRQRRTWVRSVRELGWVGPIRRKTGHFGAVLPVQSLGLLLANAGFV